MHSVRAVRFLTAAQLATLHDTTERTVRRWVRIGCPVAKRGKAGHRSPLFDAAAVEEWLERNAGHEQALVGALCFKLDAQSRAAALTLAGFGLDYLEPLLRGVRTSGTVREARAQLAQLQGEIVDIRNRTQTPEQARQWIRETQKQIWRELWLEQRQLEQRQSEKAKGEAR